MVERAACQEHEDTIEDKTSADATANAGDLSSSCWKKPESVVGTTGSPLSDTSTLQPTPVPGGDSKGSGSSLSRLGFPDTNFDLSAGAEAKSGDKPPSQTERSQVTDQGNNAQVSDAQNPPPETWKYDDHGNLLQAGDRVKASYDQQGNLQKVQIDDKTFERIGKDVVETYKGNDGQMHTYVNKDVASFTMKTEDNDFEGPFKSVIIQDGGHSLSSKIWESPEHTAAVAKIWEDSRQRSIDVANSTPDHPHPDTWKLDANRNVLEAGNKFSAEYDPKTGELISAKLGDDEWRRGPDNTVIQTHKLKDGTIRTETYTDVRSFTAQPYTDTKNGLLAGMTVSVGEGKTGESSHSVPIYENEEHANWSNGIVNSWVGKAKSK